MTAWKYTYFVSYYYNTAKGIVGFGNCEFSVGKKLDSITMIRETEKLLRDKERHIILLNFRLLRKEKLP